jgi:hypothetical protein
LPLSPVDHAEVTTLIARLCQALDLSRPSEFAEVFTPDGVYQAVSSEATGRQPRFRHEGYAELLAFAKSAVQRRQGLGRHWTGNAVVDGDETSASAVSYVLFVEIDPGTRERRIPISGVHHDSFVKTAKGWRFTSRTVVADI